MISNLTNFQKKDRKILQVLELDSRATISEIAKACGLSKSATFSRLKNIEESGIIDRYIIGVNYRALDYTHFRLYLKFSSMSGDFESEISRYLKSHGAVAWFSITQGEWDLIVRFLAKDTDEFGKYSGEFFAKFGKFVKSSAFTIAVSPAYHRCTQLTGNAGASSEDATLAKTDAVLSKSDFSILHSLFDNSRMPITELAGKAGISPEAASYRIKRLRKLGIITSFYARFNRIKLGYMNMKATLWLSDKGAKNALRKYCEAHEAVSFYSEMLGPWDFEIDFDVESIGRLHGILLDLRAKFPQAISDYSVLAKVMETESNPFGRRALRKSSVPKSP